MHYKMTTNQEGALKRARAFYTPAPGSVKVESMGGRGQGGVATQFPIG